MMKTRTTGADSVISIQDARQPAERIDIGVNAGNAARVIKSAAVRVESLLSHPYSTEASVEDARKALVAIAREALMLHAALPPPPVRG